MKAKTIAAYVLPQTSNLLSARRHLAQNSLPRVGTMGDRPLEHQANVSLLQTLAFDLLTAPVRGIFGSLQPLPHCESLPPRVHHGLVSVAQSVVEKGFFAFVQAAGSLACLAGVLLGTMLNHAGYKMSPALVGERMRDLVTNAIHSLVFFPVLALLLVTGGSTLFLYGTDYLLSKRLLRSANF